MLTVSVSRRYLIMCRIIQLLPGLGRRYPKRHSTYGRVKVKTIQLFLGKYREVQRHIDVTCYNVTFGKFRLWKVGA